MSSKKKTTIRSLLSERPTVIDLAYHGSVIDLDFDIDMDDNRYITIRSDYDIHNVTELDDAIKELEAVLKLLKA